MPHHPSLALCFLLSLINPLISIQLPLVLFQARSSSTRDDTDAPPVPVTVRQLEAIIRIAESFAKMSLTVSVAHVSVF